MQKSALVVAGNSYLATRAVSAGAKRVEIIPTAVDVTRYGVKLSSGFSDKTTDAPRIVWIGTPYTVSYLRLIGPALQRLAERIRFQLRIIGGGSCPISGINAEVLPWTAASECKLIAECDVGIMPLLDTPWEQGKCGYKLIQFMACGLPTVASPVGANVSIVVDGQTGYFAESQDEWVEQLERLLMNPGHRRQLGATGRARVEKKYSLQVTGPRYAQLLTQLKGA